MRLGTRIFLCYLLIIVLCFSYPLYWGYYNLKIRYLESVEEPLVDQANLLAAIVGYAVEQDDFHAEEWHKIFESAYSRKFSAQIYSLIKKEVDLRVYITDKSGNVMFDSEYRDREGQNYAAWRDVHLTLQGEYGSRTTRENPRDPNSPIILYVAAPIYVAGEIAGVLTVAKPTTNINTFLQNAKPKIVQVGAVSTIIAIGLGFLVSLWLTRPIQRLTGYANEIRQGRRVEFPVLDRSEIGEMGDAFERMREALEGKQYVEQYVQTLTHEIKSPLSAIKGAAELLEEDVPPERRARFLSNIRDESTRIQKIVDRMLALAALENQKYLQKMERLSFESLVKTVLESKEPMLSQKKLNLKLQLHDDVFIEGDSFLLHQALSNLMQNAIDFSPKHNQLELRSELDEEHLHFIIEDNGPGIPDYALDKVFEKFFSLQRPDSGKKSTGLGLNFVKEVVTLHHGDVRLENRKEQGVRACLSLPL